MSEKLDEFTTAYLECAVWASTDDDDKPLDQSDADLAPEAVAQMQSDCTKFQTDNADTLANAYNIPGYNPGQAGHDFWLTRNHHGAGFWDRGLGDVGEKLTELAHAYGEAYLYIGDDGQIYHS